jgi:hypothetical protein
VEAFCSCLSQSYGYHAHLLHYSGYLIDCILLYCIFSLLFISFPLIIVLYFFYSLLFTYLDHVG